jgi:hypothetical protein
MTIAALRILEKKILADNKITRAEATALINATNDGGRTTAAEKAEIAAFLAANGAKFDPGAKALITKFVEAALPPPPPPPSTDIVKSISGPDGSSFEDDTVFLGRDGKVEGEANVPSYTRSYDSTKQGPLRQRHGSEIPASTLVTADEAAAIKANTPGQALDAVAKIFGASVNGFEKMANSKDFFNESADYWWGKCHAWTWSSLSTTIDNLVDVKGPEGQRGLWVAGQFISRADLGNWMMATADTISVNDGNQLFKDDLSALDLLKGSTEYMMNNGGGVVADVWNDKKKGSNEVWNQPFVGASIENKTMSDTQSKDLLALAKSDGIEGTQVKQVTIVGTYGVEKGDDYEDEPGRSSKTWNMYVVTDAQGKALTSYMADDQKLKAMTDLPTQTSDDIPEYFWKPTLQALTDILAGKQNDTVDYDAHGKEFKFFVGTVLKTGVPATTRTAFETEFAALPAGNVDAVKLSELQKKYPTIANAYSPEQWKRGMSSRGLDAASFGASWPTN